MSRTKAERETVVRFDETDELAYLSTFSASQARRWARAGVVLMQRGTEWLGRVEKAAVRGCRRVQPDGSVVKAHRQGRFGRSETAGLSAVRGAETGGTTTSSGAASTPSKTPIKPRPNRDAGIGSELTSGPPLPGGVEPVPEING